MNTKDLNIFSNNAEDDAGDTEPELDPGYGPQPAGEPDEEGEEGGLEMYPDEDVDPTEFGE